MVVMVVVVLEPGLGGGHCLFEGRYPKQNYRPLVLCYHSLLSLFLLVYSPLFFAASKESLLLLLLLLQLAPSGHHFRPDTFTLITVAETLIIANPGYFPWTSQANNDIPNRKYPSYITAPLLRVLGSVTAPFF